MICNGILTTLSSPNAMEGDLSDGELPDDQIQPPSRDDLPDADPALVRRGRASPYPPTASDRVQKPVDATHVPHCTHK